jgi:two-component system response regulator HydG
MKRILFIDDDVERLASHLEMLQVAGYEVLVASDVQTALSLVEEHGRDLSAIVLDMIMPFGTGVFDEEATDYGHRTGIALLKEITSRASGIPLIICTVVHDPEAKAEAMRLSAVRYITKPVLPSTLIEQIEEVSLKKD